MNDQYEVLAVMSWVSAALIFIPPLILAAKLEWEEWSEAHPEGFHFRGWYPPHPAH